MSFDRDRVIPLRSTDAAGVLFFAEQLGLVHDVYEEFLAAAGYPVRRFLDEGLAALPIVKAETELLRPIRVGDTVTIALSLAERPEPAARSFTVQHTLTRAGELVGRGRTVHVWLDRRTQRPAPPAEDFAEALMRLLG